MIIKQQELPPIDETLPVEEIARQLSARVDDGLRAKHVGDFRGRPLFLIYGNHESSGRRYAGLTLADGDDTPQMLVENICEFCRRTLRLTPVDVLNIGGHLADAGLRVI